MIVDYIYGVMYARFFMFCIMGSILKIIALFVLLKNKHKVNVYFLIYGLLGNILGGMLIFFLSEFILNLSHFEFFYAFKSMFYSTMLPAYIHCLIIVFFYFFPGILSVQVCGTNGSFFPYSPVLSPFHVFFPQIQEELPFPHRRQLSVTIKNRHTIKYCWHPHTKQKPVRHPFVLLTNATIALFHSFVNLFVHFSKYLLFF